MILFNFTGLRRIYWKPVLQYKNDKHGLWFTSIRWLNSEVVFYSKVMATEFISRLNDSNKEFKT
jgi:hypothetical protein